MKKHGDKEKGYAAVRHSGFVYGGNPDFRAGLEAVAVTAAMRAAADRAGGRTFDTYQECEEWCHKEMYPSNYDGLIPKAAGSFARVRVRGLAVYVPKPK